MVNRSFTYCRQNLAREFWSAGLRHSCNRCAERCGRRRANSGMGRNLRLSGAHSRGAAGARQGNLKAMAARGFAFLLLGLLAGGCVQSTLEMASDANLTPRDKKLLG